MDMSVHRDRGLAETMGEDEVRALGSDAGQRFEAFPGLRHDASLFDDRSRQCVERSRLLAIEAGAVQQFLETRQWDRPKLFRVWSPRQKIFAHTRVVCSSRTRWLTRQLTSSMNGELRCENGPS